RSGATSVALGNAVRTSTGSTGFVSETFIYAPGSGTWTITALPNRFFDSLRATAPLWVRGTQWILAGTESFGKKTMPVRIAYTDLGGNSFRREHQVQVGGMWRDDAAYVCRRDSVATTPFGVASPVAFTPAVGIAKPSPAPPAVAVHPRTAALARSTAAPTIVRATAAPVIARPATAAASIRPSAAPLIAQATIRPPTAPVVVRATTAAVIVPTTVPVVALATATPALPRSAPSASRPWRFAAWHFAPAPTATPRAAAATAGRDGSQRLALAPKPTPAPTAKPTPTPKPAPVATAKPTPTPKPSSPPKRVAFLPPPPAARDDRPYGLIGSWACRTTTGQPSTQTYTLDNDGAIALRNALTLGGRRYEIDETYHFDPTRDQWQNVTAGGAYRGTAPPWRGATWTFDGLETEGTPSEVHMTYTTLGPATFRRQFARNRSGAWVPYLSEICRRG
ncbi:MAG: hypothetical protein GIX01_04905, partial [Candidatus Eremiobacteraeota bacterium]|nr:hypothetical protein [Candidatus Eremiobacteraeota bacterium]